MENKSQWVGIDVSKATLDVYLRPIGKAIKIDNNEEGITDLVKQLKAVEINCTRSNRRIRNRSHYSITSSTVASSND
jgi:transposase